MITIRHDHYFHFPNGDARALAEIKQTLAQLVTKIDTMSDSLDNLKAVVEAESTVIDSAVALLNGLSEKIAALEPNQAAIDALAAEVKAKSDALAEAVTANTPSKDN